MTRVKANLLLMLAAIIWGSTFVVQQVGTGTLGPLSFTATRFLVGSLVVLPLALRQYRYVQRNLRPFQRSDWYGLLITGAVLFTAAVLQQIGILNTTVTNAGFLTALYVPLVPLLGLLFLRLRVHWSIWPAALGCLLGTWLLSGADSLELKSGDLWVIGSALFWAIHVHLVGRMASITHAPLLVAVVQFGVAGLFGIVLGVMLEAPTGSDFASALPGILYAGLLSVGVGFTLQVVGQRYTPAADAAIILSSETLFAAVAGFLFLGEHLNPEQLAGATLILIGIVSVQLLPLLKQRRNTA